MPLYTPVIAIFALLASVYPLADPALAVPAVFLRTPRPDVVSLQLGMLACRHWCCLVVPMIYPAVILVMLMVVMVLAAVGVGVVLGVNCGPKPASYHYCFES